MADFKEGVVKHYYDKIKVAVVEFSGDVGVGDKIKFVRGGEDLFEQEIVSMQVEHKKVKSAKKNEVVGLMVDKEVKEGAEIYKLQ